MISLIHYISAKRRLSETNKTIHMLGGEIEAPEMMKAQRDMIAFEVDYYSQQVKKESMISAIVLSSAVLVFLLFYS